MNDDIKTESDGSVRVRRSFLQRRLGISRQTEITWIKNGRLPTPEWFDGYEKRYYASELPPSDYITVMKRLAYVTPLNPPAPGHTAVAWVIETEPDCWQNIETHRRETVTGWVET